jgi:hypothetical protein
MYRVALSCAFLTLVSCVTQPSPINPEKPLGRCQATPDKQGNTWYVLPVREQPDNSPYARGAYAAKITVSVTYQDGTNVQTIDHAMLVGPAEERATIDVLHEIIGASIQSCEAFEPRLTR